MSTASSTDDRRQLLREIEALQRQIDELRARIGEAPRRRALSGGDQQLLLCVVAGETIALRLEEVDEVVPFCALAPIPEAPPWVPGLLKIRGSLIPTIDARRKITGAELQPGVDDYLVVCTVERRRLALIVQDVMDLVEGRFEVADPQADDTPLAPYLVGVIQVGGRPVFLVSVLSLLEVSGLDGVGR